MNEETPTVVDTEVPRTPRPARRASLSLLLPVLSLGFLLIVWALIVAVFDVPKYVIPSPAAVFSAMADNSSELISNAKATAEVAALGLLVSVAVGVPLGLLIGEWRVARRLLMTPLVAMQALPKVALAPLFVAWLGFGMLPKLIITVLITFFPLTLATIVGVESLTRTTIRLSQSMGCSGSQRVRFIDLPTAAPYVSAAFRTAATLAVVGALVAEFVGSSEGLGNMLLIASGERDTTLAFGVIIAVALLGILFYTVAAVIVRVATLRLGSEYMRSVT